MAKVVQESTQPKYSLSDGCSLCNAEYSDMRRMAPNQKEYSKMICENCGAIYHNLNINDRSIAGTWTGTYGEIGRDKRMEHGFAKDDNNNEE